MENFWETGRRCTSASARERLACSPDYNVASPVKSTSLVFASGTFDVLSAVRGVSFKLQEEERERKDN